VADGGYTEPRATNEVGVCFYIDLFHTNLLHQDGAVRSDPMDVSNLFDGQTQLTEFAAPG